MLKLTIKQRLLQKSNAELSRIYIRLTGKDLLRGRKIERVQTLYSLLKAKKDWEIISRKA